jgi:excinuclease ABC subunit C
LQSNLFCVISDRLGRIEADKIVPFGNGMKRQGQARMDANWHACFTDFGDDPLMPYGLPELGRVEAQATEDLRILVRRHAPKVPGVYGMLDATGRLIYVGKSKLLRNRLLSYFMPNNEDEKAGRIIQSAETIVWEKQPSEFASLLREQMLIRRFQPRMNVVGMPKRQQQAYLCLGHGPAEQFYLSKHFDSEAKSCQGPFLGMGNLHRAVEVLNRLYLLRDCSQKTPMLYSDQLQLFDLELRPGCVRQEIGTCLAPCLPTCSRTRYADQVKDALRFLQAESASIQSQLELQMLKASQGRHFEHAARLREDLRILKWLTNRLALLRRARENYSFVYRVQGEASNDIWYLIRKGGVEAALAAPSSARQWQSIRGPLHRWHSSQATLGNGYLRGEETLGLVASWFQKDRNQFSQTFVLNEIPVKWSDWVSAPKVNAAVAETLQLAGKAG